MPINKQNQIKLVTYNIHRCVGTDGITLPERILFVLDEIQADVVALQELEMQRNNALNLLTYFGRYTGLTLVAGPTVFKPNSRYGNALLTRLPIISTRRIDLTVPGHEPRGALDLDLEWHGRKIHLITTHLGLNPGERRHQVRHLLKLIQLESADLTVLMGDINEWFLWGRTMRWLKRVFPDSPRCRTFPSGLPLFALDRIWIYPPACLTEQKIHDSRMARAASDHLPLQALVEMD